MHEMLGKGGCGDLAKVIQLISSLRTSPEEVSSSAKLDISIPSSSCSLNWIPACVSMSMESCAYMSSLQIVCVCVCESVQ